MQQDFFERNLTGNDVKQSTLVKYTKFFQHYIALFVMFQKEINSLEKLKYLSVLSRRNYIQRHTICFLRFIFVLFSFFFIFSCCLIESLSPPDWFVPTISLVLFRIVVLFAVFNPEVSKSVHLDLVFRWWTPFPRKGEVRFPRRGASLVCSSSSFLLHIFMPHNLEELNDVLGAGGSFTPDGTTLHSTPLHAIA